MLQKIIIERFYNVFKVIQVAEELKADVAISDHEELKLFEAGLF